MGLFGGDKNVVPATLESFKDGLVGLGFDVQQKDETTLMAKHQTYFNVVLRLSSNRKEALFLSYFGVQPSVQRMELLEAINSCNQSVTVSTFSIDKDGDVVMSRCLPCHNGYTVSQFEYVIEESMREIAVAAAKHLKEYLK
ncbi:MAG: YbjN domain-containing protein [Acidobacteriota bacterium]|nr:MAG: YbjN domain-containing protein [Acidobacteriota bacterium]